MAKHESNAVWTTIDPASLSETQADAYAAYKALYRSMKDAREAFEGAMQAGVPDGQRMILGYNFGKLSAAIVPDDRKPAKAKATTQSLAEFLAAQSAQGHRC